MTIFLLLTHFWLYHPALLYGIAFLLGLFCHLEPTRWLLIPCLSLWLPFILTVIDLGCRENLKPLTLSILVFLTAWMTAAIYYLFPLLPSEGIQGTAYVNIKSIDLQHSLFGDRWVYQCEVQQFIPENMSHSIASHLPCLFFIPTAHLEKKSRPLAEQDYWVFGKLMQTKQRSYLLKISSRQEWIIAQKSHNWSEQRYKWKRKVIQWIETQFVNPWSSSFLAGLVTGKFDDSGIRQQFARFGLQHLLAISGFHFAIIAGFLSFVLRFIFPERIQVILLFLFLGMYCFFLGPQASILRAWIMCSLSLLGKLIDKQTTALNSLGCALLMTLGYNPLLCKELGFQLSFSTTAAILLFYQPSQAFLCQLFPKRHLSEVLQMNNWNQHGYCILSFLRKSLSLTLAVNLFALPLTFYYFQQFSCLSLLYNLFFPILASGSLFLLLLGGLLTFLPFLAHAIHNLNDAYTSFILQLTYQVPSEIDYYLTIKPFDSLWLILYLCLASIGGILWKEKHSSNDQKEIFSFI